MNENFDAIFLSVPQGRRQNYQHACSNTSKHIRIC
jgi:hypothetical protein